MTYLVRRSPVRARRPQGMGGDFFDTLFGAGGTNILEQIEKKEELNCLKDANATPAVKEIDAKTLDLAKNWNPTGYYTAADIQTVYTSTMDAITKGRAALMSAVMSTSDAEQVVAEATNKLVTSTERAALYTQAIAAAQASGSTVINAPGLKQWVLDSLLNVSNAYVTVAVLFCRSTWLDTAAAVISAVWAVVKRVIGIALKIGDTVLKVADDVLGLYTVLKWGALGVGAFLVISKLRDMRKK